MSFLTKEGNRMYLQLYYKRINGLIHLIPPENQMWVVNVSVPDNRAVFNLYIANILTKLSFIIFNKVIISEVPCRII